MKTRDRLLNLWPPHRRRMAAIDAYLAIPEHREQWVQFARRVAQLGYSIAPTGPDRDPKSRDFD